MDENKNNEEHYTLVVPTEDKKFWGRVKDWFADGFKGFWYGLTDLFLMSWGNIILLVFLLFVPLAYAVVCALGYWNPVINLGKVEMPIFDADRTFIKVEEKDKDQQGNYVYHIGALEKIGNDEVTDDKAQEIANNILQGKGTGITGNVTLNNGFIVDSSEATFTPMNTWDVLKNSGLLKNDKPNKADEDSKFELTVYPNDELHFRNIRYISDANDDNDEWKSGKYQAQVKINHGYGKALLGVQGIAYDKDFGVEMGLINPKGTPTAKETTPNTSVINPSIAKDLISKNQAGTLPDIDIFQTFQRNFVSSYILSQTAQFGTVVADKMSPVTNAIESNTAADKAFGTKGQDIINFLNQAANPVKEKLKPVISKINAGDYYTVLSAGDLLSALGIPNGVIKDGTGFDAKTLLGKDGTMSWWLSDVHYFANTPSYIAVNQDKGSDLQLLDKAIKGQDGSGTDVQFLQAIDYALTGKQANAPDWEKFIGNLSALLGLDLSKVKIQQPAFKNNGKLLPFLPSKVNGQDVNIFTLSSKLLIDNKDIFGPLLKPFTDLGMPMTVNLLGTYWSAKEKIMSANGVDPSKLTNIETARGASMGIFGIGLGQMFILLGTFIGYSMLREILKRNKQYAKLAPRNWYLSKMADYAVIGFIQTTITAWVMYAAGWNKYISATAMTYEWLWLLMGTFILMAVICGLQFAMNASLGSVLGIFYLAFNITCSGASYPGWMQSNFYWGISWLMPFTYLLEGSNQIIYGINNGGGGHYTTIRLLELWGYSSCFFAFFFLIGLWGSGKQYKVSCYGSSKGAAVYAGLKRLDRIPEMVAFRHPYKDKKGRVKFKYNWNALVGPFDSELYRSTKHTIKKHAMFKWYYNLREKRKIEEKEIYGER